MRQSEFKMKYDPELGKYTKQHIYGEGMMDVFKSFGKKICGKTIKTAAKKGTEKALTTPAANAGKKAADKIVKMLSKSGESKTVPKSKKDYRQLVGTLFRK